MHACWLRRLLATHTTVDIDSHSNRPFKFILSYLISLDAGELTVDFMLNSHYINICSCLLLVIEDELSDFEVGDENDDDSNNLPNSGK